MECLWLQFCNARILAFSIKVFFISHFSCMHSIRFETVLPNQSLKNCGKLYKRIQPIFTSHSSSLKHLHKLYFLYWMFNNLVMLLFVSICPLLGTLFSRYIVQNWFIFKCISMHFKSVKNSIQYIMSIKSETFNY